MSMHTEKKASRRGGKKLWLLVPAAVVVLLAGVLLWVNAHYVYAGGFHRRDSAQLDLRGKGVSEEKYLSLHEQLPNCVIFWDVPVGGTAADCESAELSLAYFSEGDVARLAYFRNLSALDITAADVSPALFESIRSAYPALSVRWSIPIGESRYPSDAESITLTDFAVSDLPLFDYFTALRAADARDCTCYDAILALRGKYPALELQWKVPLGGAEYLQDAADIAVDDVSLTPDALRTALRYLPAAQTVSFPDCPWSEEEKTALRGEFPNISFRWSVELFGTSYPSDTAELSFAGRPITAEDLSELGERLSSFSALERVDLMDTGVALEDMLPLCEAYPAVDFAFTFDFLGLTVNSEDTLLDLTGIPMESTEAVESILPVMHRLEKVDMTDCGFSDEEMDALNKRHEDVRFVWTMYITHYVIRTDAVGFIASTEYYGYFTAETIMKLKYCEDLRSLDLGHRIVGNDITTLDVLYELPQLEYLVLADCRVGDLTPIGSLKNLKFLEMTLAYSTSFEPLLDCGSLEHLNVCFNWQTDADENFAVFSQMKQLKRLYISVGMVSEENIEKLRELLPDTKICVAYDIAQATAMGWRYDESYYDMRDLLGMFYMGDFGGRQYSKTINGEEIPLDPEFIASQSTKIGQRHTS